MSKFALLASSMLLAFVTPASAEVLFRGMIKVTAVQSCPNGPNVGDLDNGQFHPRGLGNNNFTALNRIWNFGATSFALPEGKNFTAAFQRVSNKSIGWADYTPDKPSFILVTSQSPKPLTGESTTVILKGKIKNPFGDTGSENCVADFEFIGFKEIS